MIDLKWEEIDSYHKRLKVPGGWIFKSFEEVYHLGNSVESGGGGWDCRIAICFVPDPSHEWKLEEENKDDA